MNTHWISFHGSPGSPRDFFLLERSLGGSWIHQDRNNGHFIGSLKGATVIAYSWGCREALRALSKSSEKPERVIFIAPYIFGAGGGLLKKLIFKIPLLGAMLVSAKGEKIASDFISESSSPDSPSEIYLREKKFLSRSDVLGQAVAEKDEFDISHVEKLDVPFLVLFGGEDKTSKFSEQISPLKNKLGVQGQFQKIKGAGHALPWNRSDEVAKSIKKFIKN